MPDDSQPAAGHIDGVGTGVVEIAGGIQHVAAVAPGQRVRAGAAVEHLALAIAVTQRCDACVGFHVKALIRLGASREQLMETLGVCTYMGGGPALMYAAEAVRAYEELLPM